MKNLKISWLFVTALLANYTCFVQAVSLLSLIKQGRIPEIHPTSFGGFELDLSHKNISDLNGLASIPYIEKVTVLRLNHNKIKYIARNTGVFNKLQNLTELHLSNNPGLILAPSVFAALPNLAVLDLAYNGIHEIPIGAFYGLSNLKKLRLLSNNIPRITPETFASLNELTELDLRFNALETIQDDSFHAQASLETLLLDGNKLKKINDKTLRGLESLQTLALRSNKLTAISTFVTVPHLISLFLQGNNFNEETLASYHRILKIISPAITLDFSPATGATIPTEPAPNPLKKLLKGAFVQRILSPAKTPTPPAAQATAGPSTAVADQMTILALLTQKNFPEVKRHANGTVSLDLSEKRLTHLTGLKHIPGIEEVTTLHLYGNALTALLANSFTHCKSLTYLNLAGNKISRIDPQAFAGTHITRLYLGGNQLTRFPNEYYNDLPKLTHLYLDSNPLEELGVETTPESLKELACAFSKLPDKDCSYSAADLALRAPGVNFTYNVCMNSPHLHYSYDEEDPVSASRDTPHPEAEKELKKEKEPLPFEVIPSLDID